MTQLILNIENPAILPSLKKVLGALEGVSIAKPKKKARRKTGLELALEEACNGEVTEWESAESLIAHIDSFAK